MTWPLTANPLPGRTGRHPPESDRGKLSADKLEEILNSEARKGWMVKAITSAEVKGESAPAVWTAS